MASAERSASGGSGQEDADDVIVLGAGVVGAATAYALARRGRSVTLVDRASGPALGASFANGAQLSYAYSDALGGPALLRKLPALALGADPLFALRPSFDLDMVRWGLDFLRECSAARQENNTLATLALALESQQAMHALLAVHRLEFGHVAAGKMHLYFDRPALDSAAVTAALKQRHGAVQHVLGADEATTIEPALRGARGLVGVVHSPEDEVGDPHRFSAELVQVMRAQYSVRTEFGFDACHVSIDQDAVTIASADGARLRGRSLVVAMGAAAGAFLKPLGISAPILPMKGYSFTAPLGATAPSVSLTDTARKLVFCRLSGHLRVAGVAELGARNPRVDPARLAALVRGARASMPEAADYDRLESDWAGLRPMTPSSMPIIARPRPRLVLNIGHGMLGWTLAMGAAERAAALTMQADNS